MLLDLNIYVDVVVTLKVLYKGIEKKMKNTSTHINTQHNNPQQVYEEILV